MFLALLKKECSCYLRSVTYFIYLAAIILFCYFQMGGFETVEKPVPGYEDYGVVRTTEPDMIMQHKLYRLFQEYLRGKYITYPVGFYKEVQLDNREQDEVRQMLLRLTGLDEKQLEALGKGEADESVSLKVREGLSFEEFSLEMKKLCEMLGAGSEYSGGKLNYVKIPATYEQALAAYESLIGEDRVTNAYARLFCDYMGILLAILPVFLAVTRALRDRKAQAQQVIYMAKAGSKTLVVARFLAAVLVTVLPVFLLGCMQMMQAIYYAKSIHSVYDPFAYVRYIGFWLLPTILVSLSVGFFLTELTDSAIAIFVQGIWWFSSVMSASDLVGSVGWNLIPRFNAVGEFSIYGRMKGQLFRNRLVYTGLALMLMILTVLIFDRKRKGEFVSVKTKLRNRKGQF